LLHLPLRISGRQEAKLSLQARFWPFFNTEVRDARLEGFPQDNIVRLQVAMHDLL
jgi:hypothetical protein